MFVLLRSLLPLLLCVVLVAPVLAAPAPFPKSADVSNVPVPTERLKQHLLQRYGFHADSVAPGDRPNEWFVLGNTPTMVDSRLVYMQNRYRIIVTGTDRRGNPTTEMTTLPMRRYVITR